MHGRFFFLTPLLLPSRGKVSLLLCLAGALLLAGCATGDPESDAFFQRGWIWPKSLDQPTEPPPPPAHSAEYGTW